MEHERHGRPLMQTLQVAIGDEGSDMDLCDLMQKLSITKLGLSLCGQVCNRLADYLDAAFDDEINADTSSSSDSATMMWTDGDGARSRYDILCLIGKYCMSGERLLQTAQYLALTTNDNTVAGKSRKLSAIALPSNIGFWLPLNLYQKG